MRWFDLSLVPSCSESHASLFMQWSDELWCFVLTLPDTHLLMVKASMIQRRSIKVIDTRSETISQDIQDAHDGCVNCVRWHPQDPSLLLSTGTDPCLHLWDLRNTKQALNTFRGHTVAAR